MKASLLVELFTEELPPKALKSLSEVFGHKIQDWLIRAGLKTREPHDTKFFATPRRLAVLIQDVEAKAPDHAESRKLMPSKVAYGPDGKPSAALLKRLEKENASVKQTERKFEDDAEYVFLNQAIPGVTLVAGLQIALQEAISKLPIPKMMSYQLADGQTTVQFVRPAHGLVALHGDKVVNVSVLGLKAGRITHGHRFQGVKDIKVATADAYEEALAAHGKVIADFDERRAGIDKQLHKKAASFKTSLGPEEGVLPLLDEVTALVEYPTVYAGEFEREFLDVPQECLILTMRANQKYFPLFDKAGKLTNKFLIVSNMELKDPENIVEGNQRVVRPRLADARFFFETDKKTRLAERVPKLASIIHHNKLGSQLQRVQRIERLAGIIAARLNTDSRLAERAAYLCKADLLTAMVGEFPELQGVMGQYYARHDGEPEAVARAIEEHYHPRFAGDSLPGGQTSQCVALADKLDTLVGIYGIGLVPTGDKDPFGLRRQALGILRILIEHSLALDARELLLAALDGYGDSPLEAVVADQVHGFMLERLRSYLRERDFLPDEIESVVSQTPTRMDRVIPRLQAVRAFRGLPEAQSLASANKRTRNILGKAQFAPGVADPGLFVENAENELYSAIAELRPQVESVTKANDYKKSLLLLATLRPHVDKFFDDVMVNAEDAKVKENRLRVLFELSVLLNQVADISKLAA